MVHGDHVTQILSHGKVLATIPENESNRLELAIITMIGFYYLFDIEYPTQLQLAFSLLSYTIFKDSKVIPAIKSQLDKFMAAFTNFKLDRIEARNN